MKTHPSLQRPGAPHSSAVEERGLARPLRAALALPLFWKIVLANALLMATVGGITAASLLRPDHETVEPAVLWVLLGGTLIAAAAVNAGIVALALRPIDRLMQTADSVRGGDLGARTPSSPLADPKLDHLRRILNSMLDALEEIRERQKVLSHQTRRAEERERERMAAEIYAGTAQTLAGVLVRLRVLQRSLAEGVDDQAIDDLGVEIRGALEELRAFARQLRPPELDEIGVRAALDAAARKLSVGEGPRIEFSGEFDENVLSDDARLALYRVVQEALSNAVRHAGASLVKVEYDQTAQGLVTTVTDDGRGFDADTLDEDGPSRLGILTMIERAGLAQGITEVDSTPGSGTRVRITLPLGEGTTATVERLLATILTHSAKAGDITVAQQP